MIVTAAMASVLTLVSQDAADAPTFIEASASHQTTLEATTLRFNLNVALNRAQSVETLRRDANRSLVSAGLAANELAIEGAYNFQNQSFFDALLGNYLPSDPPDFISIRGTGSPEAANAVDAWARSLGEVTSQFRSGTDTTPAAGQLIEARRQARALAEQNANVLATGMGCQLGQAVEERFRRDTRNSISIPEVYSPEVGTAVTYTRRSSGLEASYTVEAIVTFEATCQ